MFQNKEMRLGYGITSLPSPTNGSDSPLSSLHWQHGEEQVFKVRSIKAMPQTWGTFTHTQPATLPQCHPHHCPPLYGMDQELHWAPTKASITSSKLANSFQILARIPPRVCRERPREEPGQGLVAVNSFIWVYRSTHTLSSLPSHWSSSHWTASHLSSYHGFSFCPRFIYFTCSATSTLKLDICIQELKSSFIKKQLSVW